VFIQTYHQMLCTVSSHLFGHDPWFLVLVYTTMSFVASGEISCNILMINY